MLKIFFIFTILTLIIACPDGCNPITGDACLCDPTNVTSVICEYGGSGQQCIFDCSQPNACNDLTLECTSTDSGTFCDILCTENSNCSGTKFLCNSDYCSSTCRDGNCQNFDMVCESDTRCSMYCNEESTCAQSTFDCTADICVLGCSERTSICDVEYTCESDSCFCDDDSNGNAQKAGQYCPNPNEEPTATPTPTPRPNYTQRSNTKYTLGTDEEDDNEKDNGAWRANLVLLSLSLC